jgi:serine/threonine-protein kinase
MNDYDLKWIKKNFSGLDRIENLSSGGQKEVFKAFHEKYGEIALKIIKPSDDEFERTVREIKAAEIINHPNVPKIYEINLNLSDPNPIWIMEQYISGRTLRVLLESGKKFSLQDVVTFLDTLLEISVQVEKKHIVHRDIKPENIMVDDQGKYWLIDFGIARHLELSSLTNTSRGLGLFTAGYAAPEQFRNIKRSISIKADLFSIGIVAMELITGRNPFVENAQNILDVLRNTETLVLSLPTIEGDTQYELAAFLRVLGDKRLSRRPSNAKEAYDIFNSIKPTLKL